MRLFLVKLSAIAGLTAVSLAAVLYLLNADDYTRCSRVKYRRLVTAASPKLVLIGGSNLLLGLDSAALERATGKTVVNMGLTAGLGLRYYLREIDPYINKGDTVVLVPEYTHFYGQNLEGHWVIFLQVMIARPGAFFSLTPAQLWGAAKAVPELIKLQKKRFFNRYLTFPSERIIDKSAFAYRARDCNQYGDMTAHLGHAGLKDVSAENVVPPDRDFNPESIRLLNEYGKKFSGKGARMFLAFPPVPDTVYRRQKRIIDPLAAAIRKELGFPLLGSPEAFLFPSSMFFDSAYHLAGEARTMRTAILATELKLRENTR